MRIAAADQAQQIALGDHGHLQHGKTGAQCLVELTRAGVAIVHRADEARGRVDRDAVIARQVDGPAMVERRVQHGQRLVFRHVDLVEHGKAAVLGAERNRAGAEDDLVTVKGIGAQQIGRVGADVKADVPARTAEGRREIFGKDVFAGGLRPGQQQVFPAQQGRQSRLPHVLTII